MPTSDPEREAIAVLYHHEVKLREMRLCWERLCEVLGEEAVYHIGEAIERNEKLMGALDRTRHRISQDIIKRESGDPQ